VEKLYLSYTGQTVGEGDPVAELYSPEAISAQKEYLLARDSYGEVKDSPQLISAGAKDLLDQSRQKLVLWGFTEKQMAVLESTKEVRNVVTINSPIRGTVLKKNVEVQKYVAAGDDLYDLADLSTVWVEADIYEYDMEWVRPGQKVRVSSRAFPGVDFSGSVSFIGATVDPATRTAKLRTALSNSGERLKPGMYVDVDVNVPLPPSILVPATAVLSTGNRTLVWVQKDSNLFQPRQVRVGTRAGDDVQILEGLNEGDRVVVSGGYLLDSESQLEGSAEMEREKLNTPDIDSRR
jgi:Cu(I)/Ag(I) efflux system membrane fusion protein